MRVYNQRLKSFIINKELKQNQQQMSFIQTATYLINPNVILNLNDIIFIIIVSFYAGRFYQVYMLRSIAVTKKFIQQCPSIKSQCSQSEQSFRLGNQSDQLIYNKQNNEKQFIDQCQQHLFEVNNKNSKVIPLKNQIKQIEKIEKNQVKQEKQQKFIQTLESHIEKTPQKNNVALQQKQNNCFQLQNEWIKQKIKLEGQKLQQKAKFQFLFEKNKDNLNLIRKIQKHQIITDYFLKKQVSGPYGENLPMAPQPAFSTDDSLLQFQYYKNYTNSNSLPIVQKRVVQLGNKSQSILSSFFQHGKFKKLYRNIIKIGQGGFGTVYQAYNMLQCKKYAIKKIFINKNSKQIQSLLEEIKILNSISHPNVVKYNSCWLEYAELNDQQSYKNLIEGFIRRNSSQKNSKNSKKIVSIKIVEQKDLNQSGQNNTPNCQQQYQQSYISSKNSAFSFMRESMEQTKKSIQFKKKRSEEQVHLAQQQGEQILPIPIKKGESMLTSIAQNSFNLLPVMYIQMELCQHSLAYYLKKRDSVDRVFAYEIMNQLINAVSYIHFNRIVHRDLKPQNVLFSSNNGQILVKLGDFGLAVQMGQYKKQQSQKFQMKNTRAGTPSYIAPELYSPQLKKLSEEDLQKTDIYSLAVIYYQMLNKFQTSHERGQSLRLLKQGKIMGINQYKQQKKLIQQMIKNNRPKAKDILLSQNWKKLSQMINQAKRRKFKNYWMQKKQSLSTNGSTQLSSSQNLGIAYNKGQSNKKIINKDDSSAGRGLLTANKRLKQKLRNSNKSRFLNLQQNYQQVQVSYDQQEKRCSNRQCQQQRNQNSQSSIQEYNQRQWQQEVQLQQYKKNLSIIKRTNSISINSNNINEMVQLQKNRAQKIIHPQLKKQNQHSSNQRIEEAQLESSSLDSIKQKRKDQRNQNKNKCKS